MHRIDRPRRTALYKLYDTNGVLLYVGIAFNPAVRWHQHAAAKTWWLEVARKEVSWHANREEAIAAEAEAILREEPMYNIAGTTEPAPKPPPRPQPPAEVIANLARAVRVHRRMVRERERQRERLHMAIRRAAASGVRQRDIVQETGYTREHVRRLLKD